MCGAQGSLEDKTNTYERDEKYALVSFASQKFLNNPELVKMYSAFYGALYEQNFYQKNETSPPFSKKILSLYEVQDFISPRQIVNFEIIIDKTKFQIKTRDGTIYQNDIEEPWFFRPPNSKKKKNLSTKQIGSLVLKDFSLTTSGMSQLTPSEMKKRFLVYFIRSFKFFINFIFYILKKFNFRDKKKIFLGIMMPLFFQFFKKHGLFLASI